MTRATLRASALACLSVVALAAPVAAWAPIDPSRPVWCGTADYALNNAGSADVPIATVETEVQRAMTDWTLVECSGLRSTYTGRTSTGTASFDGHSVIRWLESGWTSSSIAIGVTAPQWSGHCIGQADMELNGQNYTWTTSPGRGSSVNLYSIVLHEGGHFYGMGHSSDRTATMYASYSGGVSMLNSDDITGICTLYPGMGAVDCTTTGCPSGQMCSSGACVPETGDGTLCSSCSADAECGGPSDLCVRFPDSSLHCTTGCRSTADCGSGQQCFSTTGGVGQCAPVDAAGNATCAMVEPECRTDADCSATERCAGGSCEARPVDRANLGEPCDTAADCNSDNCLATPTGSVCSQSCDWLMPTSCPSGFYCDGNATGICGDGLCVAGTAGAGGLEAACSVDTDCDSLVCADGRCAIPCVPGGVSTACPEGLTCQTGTRAGCGTCAMAGTTGDACETVEDCESRICALRGDISFCTAPCATADDCPAGFTCEAAGGISVCAPPAGYVPPMMGGGGDCRGGCCAVAPGAPSPGSGLAAVLAVLALAGARRFRRRRASPRPTNGG